MFETIWSDARSAVRSLRRTPGFTIAAVLTLALGIGGTTAIVSAVDAVLMRPLPYDDPDRVVTVWEEMSAAGIARITPAPANYFDWASRNRVFEAMAATAAATANITGDSAPEQVIGRRVTANFFQVVGARPFLGRSFSEDEDRQSAPVVVISYRLWQRRYLGDSAMIGRTITLNGATSTVIGVMPERFVFRNREIDFWSPISFTPELRQNRRFYFLNVVARLAPGVPIALAREQMTAIAQDLAREHPENKGSGVQIVPVREDVLGDTRQQLIVLSVAAACMLLIGCANLASLLMARAWTRRREMATRAALGATRTRLVARLTTEGIVLSVCGGIVGLAVAMAGIDLLGKMVPTTLAENTGPVLDGRILGFALMLSVLTGVAFSIVPALVSSRASLSDDLKRNSASSGGSRYRTRSALSMFQVGTTFVLLIGAGLMVQSLAKLRAVDIGFSSEGLLTMRTTLPVVSYGDPKKRQMFYDAVLEGVRTLAGVRSAAFASTLPFLSLGNTAGYRIEGHPIEPGNPPDALFRVTTTDYLETLGVKLLDGRLPNRGDGPDSPPIVVINQRFAQRYWRNENALGHRIALTSPGAEWMTIVGVVADILETGYERGVRPGMYVLASQVRRAADNLVIRVAGDPLAVVSATRRVISRVDAEQPVAAVRTMDEIIDLEVVDRRGQSILLTAFAASALLLAAIGLYGLLSHLVAQQRQEIGIRMALGATANGVKRAIVGRGLALTGAGLAVGVLAALAGTGIMRDLLFGVQPNDPETFVVVGALLITVSLMASWIPARRATRIDPMTTLRAE
jgi:predicted permease